MTRRRLDSPLAPLLAAVPLSAAFVVLRWMHAAQHQLGQFVVAGARYATASRVPKSLPVHPGSGYDGEFYYRLALDPFDLARRAFGIRLDSFSRVERLGYPFLAWLVARGQHADVPLALVVVNVLACGVLALAGGLVARSAGRHALWGLVFAGYWGYLWTLSRDLSELVAAALVMLGLAALLRHKPIWGGLAFLGAVLSKETAVLLVGTLAVVTVWCRVTQHRSDALMADPDSSGFMGRLTPKRSDLVFAIPIVGFGVWELVLLAATGRLPIFKSGGENLAFPFVGMVHGFRHYLTLFPSVSSALWFGELALLIVLAVGAGYSLRSTPLELRFLWVISVLLGLSAATGIWLGDVGFRSLDDAYLMSWVVLLFRRGPVWPWGALCAGAWLVVGVELIRYI